MLAGFLHVAAAEKTNERVAARDAELVWTGPDEGNPRARRTFPVVNELLEFASRQVTIVGYSLFLSGSSAKALLARLGTLSSEGVNVEFIVDRNYAGYHGSNGAGHSVREIHEHWPANHRRPVVRSWTSPDGDGSKLHAKVMIVDRQELLVTSANLTGAGLATNLEIGLRVRGRAAAECADHFAGLTRAGFFATEPWPDAGGQLR